MKEHTTLFGERKALHPNIKTSSHLRNMVEGPSWFSSALLPQGLDRLISLNSGHYQDLLQNIRPFLHQLKLNSGLVMQQDNDPKHRIKSTEERPQQKNTGLLEWPKNTADHLRSHAPRSQSGHKVWFSSMDLALQVELKDLAPKQVGPYEIHKLTRSSVVQLKLPPALSLVLSLSQVLSALRLNHLRLSWINHDFVDFESPQGFLQFHICLWS